MRFDTVRDCKDQCAKDSECVAIEYNGPSKKCEIHTDTITHVSVKSQCVGEDAALYSKCQTECWKKQAMTNKDLVDAIAHKAT